MNGRKGWVGVMLLILLAAALLLPGLTEAAPKAGPPAAKAPAAALAAAAQSVGTGHAVTLTWTASTSAPACSATATPPCTFGYYIYRGTAAGAEAATPLNAGVLLDTTYVDPITLTGSPQKFYYYVQAVETVDGVTAVSAPSNEVSATFPGIPAPPTGVSAKKD